MAPRSANLVLMSKSSEWKRQSNLKLIIMANLKYSIGLDIGKAEFDACVSVIDDTQKVTIRSTSNFKNHPSGFIAFFSWVRRHLRENLPSHFLMEATGIYYEKLAWFLYQKDCTVSVILPNKAKKYLQGLGLKSKNDRIDAKGLARMCAEQALDPWRPLSKNIYKLRALTRLHEDLSVQNNSLNNRLEALEQSMFDLKDSVKALRKLIIVAKKELKNLEIQIEETISNDSLLKAKYEKINRIKGVGLMTFAVIIAETNGFELFKNIPQLTSYAGYDIVENQSGKRSGKTKMSKKGNPHIRRILHMPAFTIVKYEPSFKKFHSRILANTNIKMKAYVAVQRRLLTLIYTLWKKDVAYNPNHSEARAADPLWGDSAGIEKPSTLCLAL
jgi:transposase